MRRKYASVFLLGGFSGVVYLIASILSSTNSTAAVGLLFLPLYFLAGALAFAIPAAALFTTMDLFKGDRSTNKILLALSAWALIAYVSAAGIIWKTALEQARSPEATESSLKSAYGRWLPFGKISVQIAAATNPAATPEILRDLWETSDGSLKTQILENPKTPPEIIASVVKSEPDYYLLSALARNPALTPASMEAIVANCIKPDAPNRKLLATYVLAPLARRKDLPDSQFQKILAAAKADPEYFLIYALVNSERASCEQAKGFLNNPDDLVEREVSAALQRKKCL